MRAWLCLLVTACGAGAEPAPAPPPAPAAPSSALRPPAPTPAPAPAPPPPLTAAHGSEIIALSAAGDGAAVASLDRDGGIRLWPALDGTREPVVIQGTGPSRAIALVGDGDGRAIATLDAAGGVHVIRTSAAGAVRGRATLAGDQPAVEIDATPEGVLVLRADQVLELVDPTGAVRARLAPEPGSHIDTVLVRGRRALALVLEDKQLHGRWIVLDHGARWGEVTPRLEGKIAHAVLSPDGERLAVTRPGSVHPVLIDLARGKAANTPLCVTKGWPRSEGMEVEDAELIRNHTAPLPLAFVSERVVACSVLNALAWWNIDGTPVQPSGGTFNIGGAPVDVSDRAVIAAMGPNLAIGTPIHHRFIGYGMHDIAHMRPGPAGLMIGGTSQESLVLGDGLEERARFDLGRNRIDWADAIAIDHRYAIAVSPRRTYGKPDDFQISVFDGVARAQRQALPYQVRDRELSYEPATRLLATTDGPVSILLRFDPRTHTFGVPTRAASAIAQNTLRLVDPKLAGGVAALEIDESSAGLLVGELGDAEIVPGAAVVPRTTYRVPGELRAVDRAGRLYMRAPGEPDVVVHTRGVAGARLPGLGSLTLRPSPDGSLIAAFEPSRLVLVLASGAVRWEAAHWGAAGFEWTADGELIAQFPSAIAKIDLATGALAVRRCGWGFGVTDQPTEAGRGGPSVCEVSR
ncbi:MAG TPA: hypothetical protein VFK02_36880 [Kofleriaceae bacterium]|nr:hypothetical protein [Kofleriaceae bacterium]